MQRRPGCSNLKAVRCYFPSVVEAIYNARRLAFDGCKNIQAPDSNTLKHKYAEAKMLSACASWLFLWINVFFSFNEEKEIEFLMRSLSLTLVSVF